MIENAWNRHVQELQQEIHRLRMENDRLWTLVNQTNQQFQEKMVELEQHWNDLLTYCKKLFSLKQLEEKQQI